MVSIIIPFNNGSKYLENCLENLKSLQYNDFEVILVDDYSCDNSEQIAELYKNKLNLKYYYTNKRTVGVGNARNLGIEKATGKYIMFLDVDDTIDNKLLINLQKYMDKDVEMIKYKMKIIENNKLSEEENKKWEKNRSIVNKINVILKKSKLEKSRKLNLYRNYKNNIERGRNQNVTKGESFDVTDGQDGFNKLCFNDKFLDSPCVYLIKKELFDRTRLRFEKNVFHEDFGLIPQLIVNAKSIVSVDFYGYNYFQSDNSIMRNEDYTRIIKRVEDKFFHYNNLIKNIGLYELNSQTKENLLSYYTNSIIMSLKDLNYIDRCYFMKKIKKENLIENINVNCFKQFIKKLLLKTNMEMYFLWQK